MGKFLRVVITGMIGIILVFNAYVYGRILMYRTLAPHRTAFMLIRSHEQENTQPAVTLHYDWVPYYRISLHLKKALIASEDSRFATHDGFDWNGIKTAMKHNEQHHKVIAGGSTISQQLAKNLFLTDGRHYWRKLEEAWITSLLEATTDKDRIFTLYLNVIEWGHGIFGAEAASQVYFHRSAIQLSPQQAAQLAARVPSPLYYADNPHDKLLRRKINIILRRMGSAQLPEDDMSSDRSD
ncbi:monofunctional biosynthetic peptidoglycan transglycosylase [Neisseriaceae bacterium ESL0693]|nr:monofunctional biosynthetic peptidoglycan transglycosylase [Neisseriaceae bacterium ESL0693]